VVVLDAASDTLELRHIVLTGGEVLVSELSLGRAAARWLADALSRAASLPGCPDAWFASPPDVLTVSCEAGDAGPRVLLSNARDDDAPLDGARTLSLSPEAALSLAWQLGGA
jgi:hypothetical protein